MSWIFGTKEFLPVPFLLGFSGFWFKERKGRKFFNNFFQDLFQKGKSCGTHLSPGRVTVRHAENFDLNK